MKKFFYTLTAGALSMLPSIALAQNPTTDTQVNPPTGAGETIYTLLQRVANTLLGISAVVAVIFLIIGGLRYVISAGNADSVETAKNTVLYSVIGLVIILLAFVIVNIITKLVGGSISAPTSGALINQ
jgi:type IV secretory pathway VirB2 component (pilin)